MLVKMKKTTPGSRDGISVQKYEAGKEYDLPEKLASAFISVGVAEEVKSASAPVNKSAGPAPANKSVSKEEAEEDAEEEAKKILAEQNAGKSKGRDAVKDKGKE